MWFTGRPIEPSVQNPYAYWAMLLQRLILTVLTLLLNVGALKRRYTPSLSVQTETAATRRESARTTSTSWTTSILSSATCWTVSTATASWTRKRWTTSTHNRPTLDRTRSCSVCCRTSPPTSSRSSFRTSTDLRRDTSGTLSRTDKVLPICFHIVLPTTRRPCMHSVIIRLYHKIIVFRFISQFMVSHQQISKAITTHRWLCLPIFGRFRFLDFILQIKLSGYKSF